MFWKKKQETATINQPMLIAFRTEDRNGTIAVHLDAEQLGNPGEAGVMLADIGRHMAHALATNGFQGGEEEAFRQITEIFNAEVKSPTQPSPGKTV